LWNIESSLDLIRCPVLVIQGEDDEYGTPKQIEAIQAKLTAAKVALLPSCRHAPHRDQPADTLRHIVKFLDSLSCRE
jgi:pimeloyl-ACP methyl ester carboxylesterase